VATIAKIRHAYFGSGHSIKAICRDLRGRAQDRPVWRHRTRHQEGERSHADRNERSSRHLRMLQSTPSHRPDCLSARPENSLGSRVPKILHYCFGFREDFGGKPLGLSHYVCIKSAIEKLQPTEARFYYEFEPTGVWWDLLKTQITPVKIIAPREIFGRSLDHPAHRSDVVRLETLIEHGGIYLDADVFVHKPFDPYLDHSVVIGREGGPAEHKLCNAVLIAEPQSSFLKRWLQEYRDFRGTGPGLHWNEHSVVRPARLAQEYPDEITIASSRAFFWPLFRKDDLRRIFDSTEQIVFDDTFATHLWESKAWHRYLSTLTPGDVRRRSGNFCA
jgi:hypothetical protein